MELKVGQQFEVVEVLCCGFYDKSLFKIGGFTTGVKYTERLIKCMANGSNKSTDRLTRMFMSTFHLNMFNHEVKPVGRLTVTKIK